MAEAGAALGVGARVRIVGLKTQADLNGITGTLVSWKEESKWQVRLDGGHGNKILKTRNLALEDARGSGAEEAEWFEVVEKFVFVKLAPSKNAKGLGLIRQGTRIQVSPARVRDADGGPSDWVELTPSQLQRLPECTPRDAVDGKGFVLIDGAHLGVGALLRGPLPWDECPADEGGHPAPGGTQMASTGGAPTLTGIWDGADADADTRGRSSAGTERLPEKPVRDGKAASKAAAPASPEEQPFQGQAREAAVQQELPEEPRGDVEWFEVVKSMVFIKENPDKDSASLGYVSGGDRIQVSRQRAYDSDVRMWVELTAAQLWRSPHCNDGAGRGFALIDGTTIGVGKLLKGPLHWSEWPRENFEAVNGYEAPVLQEHRFRVADSSAFVHEAPADDSPKFNVLRQGSCVVAEEETFDGWARLTNEGGWVRRCKRGERLLITPLEDDEETPPLLASMEVADRPGMRRFQVVARPRAPVRAAPTRKARLRHAREWGEFVWAESQTYDGWVRLKDDEGWILGYSLEEGPYLHAMLFEDVADWCKTCRIGELKWTRGVGHDGEGVNASKRAATANLTTVLASIDPEEIRFAVLAAKAWGIPAQVTKDAEMRLDELRRFGGGGGEPAAGGDGHSGEPKEDSADVKESSASAIAGERGDMIGAAAAALEDLVAAFEAGDAAAIREATKLAKAAGVSKKDIARAHALNCT